MEEDTWEDIKDDAETFGLKVEFDKHGSVSFTTAGNGRCMNFNDIPRARAFVDGYRLCYLACGCAADGKLTL